MSEQDWKEWHAEWRDGIGRGVMSRMTCNHYGSEAFGDGAVCETCFADTQRIGAFIERHAARAFEQGRDAERRDWDLTADLATPDEEREPWPNPYRALPPTTLPTERRNPDPRRQPKPEPTEEPA